MFFSFFLNLYKCSLAHFLFLYWLSLCIFQGIDLLQQYLRYLPRLKPYFFSPKLHSFFLWFNSSLLSLHFDAHQLNFLTHIISSFYPRQYSQLLKLYYFFHWLNYLFLMHDYQTLTEFDHFPWLNYWIQIIYYFSPLPHSLILVRNFFLRSKCYIFPRLYFNYQKWNL